MSLEELYSYLRSYMDPDSETARKRYMALKAFFNWTVKKTLLPDGRRLRILDLCAGTGIAGAALLEVLTEWGVEASLTLVDKRKEDILKVESWLNGEREVYGAVMDCLDDLSKLGEFDVVLLWGYTMPHFDPYQAADLFTNVSRILTPSGVFMIEEMDRFGTFFYRKAYREIVPEVKGENYTVVSLDEGYDPLRGVIIRGYYRLPGWEKIGEIETRYWDLAGLAGMGKLVFERVRIIPRKEHGNAGVGDILYFREPKTQRA
ncbi:methyltransferase domain-containing protein [Thermococcus gorgonarius]|uniref:SAM-dependent methyltransferase n=1 Tax=Thermococcus gorgonarius TaxID=71997 RepID=A0A2Z2M518_THEGO|nr:class I SAM-dependent methyltransferase [Thermococcus gorgonarius]ASJ00997.1 SAM-dependent methyltransferase [Thermococcus gorgonarius]